MSFLPSRPEARLLDVFRDFPDVARPLLDFHEALMRGPSPLSVAERELIAAYVSALNSCGYCHGVHQATAAQFGIDEELLRGVLEGPRSAAIDETPAVLLDYVAKVTTAPSRLTTADADGVYAAGWPEAALRDAVAVASLFNCMNRLVDGLGVAAAPDYLAMSGARLHSIGYSGLKDLL